VVDTPSGTRYTRNGHLSRRADGLLATADGVPVQGATGPIKVGEGAIEVDADGTVRHEGAAAGRLRIVAFDRDANLVRETALRVRSDGSEPQVVAQPSIKSGSLEQSNVSIVERLAELTSVSRSFEALQRALSVLMNDVDTRAIAELGRK
jgi:flagellar basal body rod protein FlgG